MPFDGIVLAAVARQLSEALTGAKIDKIYQPEQDEIILHINARREKLRLFVSANSANPRIHLAPEYGSNPQTPKGFCMLLRKHIQGGRLSCIAQKGSERIIEFSIDTVNELGFSQSKKLIVEIMGKHSNIILIDSTTDTIIDSIKRLTPEVNRYRQTLPGSPYIAPPSHDKISWYDLAKDDVAAMLAACEAPAGDRYGAANNSSADGHDGSCSSDRSNADVGDDRGGGEPSNAAAWRSFSECAARGILNGIQGISPRAADELAAAITFRSGGSPWNVISDLVSKISAGDFTPRVYIGGDGAPFDFHAFALPSLENACEVKHFNDISSAVEFYYSNKESSNRMRQKTSDLLKAVNAGFDKLLLKKQRLSEDLVKAENSGHDRLLGELLTANLHNIKQGQKTAELLNYYDGASITVELDPRLTPSQNAQRFYKRYTKAKTAVIEKNNQLAETNRELSYLESVLTFLENASTSEEADAIRQELIDEGYLRRRKASAQKKATKPSFLSYRVDGGFQALAGRNNRENDVLTFKKAAPGDIWFHTKDIPGTHVILLTNGAEPPAESIRAAASAAAWHSRARDSENVPVDYTFVKYVKKPSGAKPGMVIFTNNKTLYVKPALPEAPERV